jgi:hypothetical protein
MRKSFAAVLVTILVVPGSMPVFAQGQGAVNGVAPECDKAPLPNYRVHVRNANTGELTGSTTSNQAGQFSFSGLQPGNYVVEIVDAAGKVVGLSPSLTVGSRFDRHGDGWRDGCWCPGGGVRRRSQPAGPRAPGERGRGRGGQRRGGDGGRGDPRGAHRRVPHGNGGSQTLEISETQRETHLGHGDTLGACAASPSK